MKKWRTKKGTLEKIRQNTNFKYKKGRKDCLVWTLNIGSEEWRGASTYENGKFMFSFSLSFSPSLFPSHSETRSLDIWDICIIINFLFFLFPYRYFFNNLINTSTNLTHFLFYSFVFLFLFLIFKFVNLFWFHLNLFLSQNPISSFVI